MDQNENQLPQRDLKSEGDSASAYNIDKSQSSDSSHLPLSEGLSSVPNSYEPVNEQTETNSVDNIDPSLVQTPKADATPFVSNFKQWIKTVAIIVLMVFIPDQVSWAFGYNSTVIYKNMAAARAGSLPVGMPVGSDVTPTIVPQAQVSGSVQYLLQQIQDKDRLHVTLNLDQDSKKPTSRHQTLAVDTKTTFTKKSIEEISQWLSDPKRN